MIIVGDISESERHCTFDTAFVKKSAVSFEEAMNYARDTGNLYIEASRESGFNMGNVAKIACQTYFDVCVRKLSGDYNE